MPLYNYKALAHDGRIISGEVAAGSDGALRRDLAAQGLLVQHIRPVARLALPGRSTVARGELALWVQELLALLRAGLTVHEALEVCADRPGQRALERVLRRVRADVGNGLALSAACREHPDVFEPLLVSAVATGEHSGDLPAVLARYLRHLQGSIALNQRIAQALAYPAFLLLVLAAALGLLFAFVLPRFTAMYAGMGAELPWATRLLMDVVERAYVFGPALLLLGLGSWLAVRAWGAGETGALRLDRVRLRLPFVGGLHRQRAMAQAVRTLATLLGAGMPLLTAMREAAEVCGNRAFAADWRRARERVSEGAALAQAFDSHALVPATVVKMTAAGEASGRLAELLDQSAEHLEQALAQRIDRATRLLEPVLMLLMGVLVGGIIIVMYLPIFSMAEVIR